MVGMSGCIKAPTVLKPQDQTILNVNRAVATIAELNKGLTATVIQLNAAGLITKADTSEILQYNSLVAKGVVASITILQSQLTWDQKVQLVVVQMVQLSSNATVLKWLHTTPTSPTVQAFVIVLSNLSTTITSVVVMLQTG